MTKESLMAMGLTEEQATKVMEGLNGSFVTKTRFNEVNEELKTAKATITERDGQLNALKTSGADAAALQAQITQLQADNAAKDQEHAAEIKKIKIENAVEKALTDAKAINPATVKPLLAAFWKRRIWTMMGRSGALRMKSASWQRRKPLSLADVVKVTGKRDFARWRNGAGKPWKCLKRSISTRVQSGLYTTKTENRKARRK